MGSLPPFVIALLLSYVPLVGISLTFCAIYAAYSEYVYEGSPLLYTLVCFIGIMLVAAIFYWIGWIFIAMGLAKYTFTDSGLLVKYPARKEILIPWEEFQQVCICYAAYTTKGPRRANTVICCVKKGETKNGYRRWKTDSFFRYRSVICIDFRESLLNGLKEKYPGTVVDLRDTPEYRL